MWFPLFLGWSWLRSLCLHIYSWSHCFEDFSTFSSASIFGCYELLHQSLRLFMSLWVWFESGFSVCIGGHSFCCCISQSLLFPTASNVLLSQWSKIYFNYIFSKDNSLSSIFYHSFLFTIVMFSFKSSGIFIKAVTKCFHSKFHYLSFLGHHLLMIFLLFKGHIF